MGCLQQLNKFTFGVKQKHPEIFSSLNFSIHKYYKDTYSNSFLGNGKMYPVWMGSATFQTSRAAHATRADKTSRGPCKNSSKPSSIINQRRSNYEFRRCSST